MKVSQPTADQMKDRVNLAKKRMQDFQTASDNLLKYGKPLDKGKLKDNLSHTLNLINLAISQMTIRLKYKNLMDENFHSKPQVDLTRILDAGILLEFSIDNSDNEIIDGLVGFDDILTIAQKFIDQAQIEIEHKTILSPKV